MWVLIGVPILQLVLLILLLTEAKDGREKRDAVLRETLQLLGLAGSSGCDERCARNIPAQM